MGTGEESEGKIYLKTMVHKFHMTCGLHN